MRQVMERSLCVYMCVSVSLFVCRCDLYVRGIGKMDQEATERPSMKRINILAHCIKIGVKCD